METGVNSSLQPNCHDQIIFAKINSYFLYPPPCKKTLWYYEKAVTDFIRRAIDKFDWFRALSNVNIDKKSFLFAMINIRLG